MTLTYIENTVKSQAVTFWERIKSPFNLKSQTIDFNKFREIMAIDLLPLNNTDENKLHDMFETVKAAEFIGNSAEASLLWDQLISFVDMKTTEKNFEVFKSNIGLDRSNVGGDTFNSIRNLYYKTDCYSLNGRIPEAKTSWYLLMDILILHLPSFTPLPLNQFDGGIPTFPNFIRTGYEKFKIEKQLVDCFTERELNFIGSLYEEARLYYEIGQFDKGDEVWIEIDDIVNSRV